MVESIRQLLSSELFMPHGHCYLWMPALLWLQVLSNGFIALAYISIAATLAYLVYRVRDIPFRVMYLAFGIFIVTCGITHLFDVWVIWTPNYWLDGFIRAITAVASVATAIALPGLVPRAVALARGAKAAHDRGIKLETMVKDLATMYERSRELERLKTEFFANVSHELRTPLALILGPAESMLAGDHLSGDQRRKIDVMARNARLLLKQVNDLLDVSKLDAGMIRPEYREADLAAVVRLAGSYFDSVARERELTLTLDVPSELPAQIDVDKIERVVFNLLSNAIKFTPPGGQVRVSVQAEGGNGARAARIQVADSGPGIPPDKRTVVFERFRQLDGGTKRRFGGTGLGLAIVRDFVELHGGRVIADAAPEGGALFIVDLPVTAPTGTPVAASAPTTEEAKPADLARLTVEELRARGATFAPSGAEGRPTVLVVEDNPEMNDFVRQSLDPELNTVGAHDGVDGLAKALSVRPDLVITDVMMPRMSGDELVRALRRHTELDGVPVLVLTAKADEEFRIGILRAGAQDYLMKPFSAEELRARAGNLAAMSRVRQVLQSALETRSGDLAAMATDLALRERELQLALDSTRAAREQAERASRFKTEFLGLVSHELRTPLTALHLQLERLRRDDRALGDKERRVVERMFNSSKRLHDLIESLLEYARIERGRLTTQIEPVAVGPLVAESVEELRMHADQKQLALEVALPGDAPTLQTDARLLRLTVVNLVANAIKFTDQGSVRVTMSTDNSACRIAVADTGPGIAQEQQGVIFEPFQQLEPVHSKHTPGFGLGLTLVREMARAIGARIELQSQIDVGSVFTVVLPLTRPAPQPPSSSPHPLAPPPYGHDDNDGSPRG